MTIKKKGVDTMDEGKTYINWLCRHCDFYQGMDDVRKCDVRCGDPQHAEYFLDGKDYLLHNAPGRPSWCHRKVMVGND